MKTRSVALGVLVTCFACGGAPTPEAAPPTPAPAASPAPAPVAAAPVAPAPEKPKEPERSLFDLQMRSLRDYVQAFNKHDAKAIAALYAEDAVFLERGEFLTAGSGAIESNYKQFFDAFPDAVTSVTRSWHRGDSVVFEYVESGTQTGPHRAHKPTGKKVGYVGASLLKFNKEGLVTSDTTYSDELTKEVQAGWAPGPLASIKVRPTVSAPSAADSWEVHKVADQDATHVKASAAQKSLYTNFAMKSEKEFLAALSDNVLLSAYDDPTDVKGKGGAASLFKEWTKTFADGKVETSDAWTTDGYFVVLGTFSGKQVGDWGPVKRSNKVVTGHFLDIAKVDKDEKVERLWSYANNYELLAHLGYRKTEVVAK